jgi:hypothetical protein
VASKQTLWINFWQGWNCALEAVQWVLTEVVPDSITPDQERLKSALLDWLAGLFPNEDLLKRKPTNSQLAGKYSVSVRTITNWRKEGCPFEDGQWAVLDWISGQRIIPPGVKTKFARQLQRRRGLNEDREDLAGLAALANDARELLRGSKAAKRLGVL